MHIAEGRIIEAISDVIQLQNEWRHDVEQYRWRNLAAYVTFFLTDSISDVIKLQNEWRGSKGADAHTSFDSLTMSQEYTHATFWKH